MKLYYLARVLLLLAALACAFAATVTRRESLVIETFVFCLASYCLSRNP